MHTNGIIDPMPSAYFPDSKPPLNNGESTNLDTINAKGRYITYLNRFGSPEKILEIYNDIIKNYPDTEQTPHVEVGHTSVKADTFRNTMDHLIKKDKISKDTLAPKPGTKLFKDANSSMGRRLN